MEEKHKQYMQLAIDEARKSKYIPTAFCVGAVIVDSENDKIISTGYSRELEGNTHAEQCALEKIYNGNPTNLQYKNNKNLPNNSYLYTTMEPCSERLSKNIPCVDRIIKDGHITKVYVGVTEPDTFIKNNICKKKLQDAGIQYIFVPGFEQLCTSIANGKA